MLINNIRKSPTFPIRNTIHAPTRGATTKTGHIPVLGNFQSTLLQEERPEDIIGLVCNMWLSIHAPTRGATKTAQQDNDILPDFNPRSYKRSDLLSAPAHIRPLNFNPRSYKRSDDLHLSMWYCILQFQSTLLQEERLTVRMYGR